MSAKPLIAATFLLVAATVAPASAQKQPRPAAKPSKPEPAPAPPPPAPAPANDAGDIDDASAGGEPEAASKTPPPEPSTGPNVDALRQEYLQLRDRLFRSRARAASVASTLYSARLIVYLDYGSGRFYSVDRATVRVDGANVYEDSEGKIASDNAARFTGFVAPGRHVVTVSVQATGKDDSRFATSTESSFTVQAVAGKDLIVSVKAQDDGDIAFAWKKKQSGSYRLHLNANVKSVKRSDSKSAPIKRASK